MSTVVLDSTAVLGRFFGHGHETPPQLQALADDLASMASTVAEGRPESADVSSFIYAMF